MMLHFLSSKRVYFIPFFLFFIMTVRASPIDGLQTNKQVMDFLVRRVSRKFKDYPVLDTASGKKDSARYARNQFFKMDIDHNHLTDLLIYGNSSLLAVLDEGKGVFSVRPIEGMEARFNNYNIELGGIDATQQPVKIMIRTLEGGRPKTDTIVYLFGSFIEYNPAPLADMDFESIKLTTSQCFGQCPVFQIKVNKDHTISYNALQYNEREGAFTSVLSREDFAELIALLKYLRPEKLSDHYAVDWTDDQTAVTEIRYNGMMKKISDYGESGSFGLKRLYAAFFSWRKDIIWEPDAP